ncbi:MAG: anaerobic ribonucleoside triphosphate reductase [Peptoniphilaceae bacterium]|jgi:anaerobic ribonucleoside-triphosphate reductase
MFATMQLPKTVLKRDGSLMPFDAYKIRNAIAKAAAATGNEMSTAATDLATEAVLRALPADSFPSVEQVQDIVEQTLIAQGYAATAKAYILYRAERARIREQKDALMQLYKEITFSDAKDADLKRENANIDANTAMGTMLKYGSEGSKHFVDRYILPEDMAQAHADGDIHIHDKDFYMLTETCCQINLTKLFENGFSTGHGYLKKPKSILSYAALACIAIQANQNEMHGGQAIPDFDYAMAPGVDATYQKELKEAIAQQLAVQGEEADEAIRKAARFVEIANPAYDTVPQGGLLPQKELRIAVDFAKRRTERATYQAMEAFIHNLNTMNSRAGAQVPFSSVNYGTDTSASGRLVVQKLLEATRAGLGGGETPIFPVQIFKVKDGVNTEETDPNYDLFRLAMRTSAERLFPNFSFLDAPFNAQYYKEGNPDTEVAYMGCRTRVMGNTHDPSRETTSGRGNLSFTSVNLPRIGIESRGNWSLFYHTLENRMDLIVRQLLHRLRIQSAKTKKNYPFLMGQGIWLDSEHLREDETIGEILKHGTLTIGFIGLAEALKAMTGKHHGESEESEKRGLEIVQTMRDYCDRAARRTGLNFSLIATPAEGLSGRFVAIDRERYGEIPGVTDRPYYTNSFHVPVYCEISAYDKIRIEAPYHALTNAGHITYVELDGDTALNLPAFEAVIRCMKEEGVGYGSVNHPVDRDPVCGYQGIIGDECPGCGRRETEEARFHRIRRITGYLVGTTDRFNDAKAAEEKDRVKHR